MSFYSHAPFVENARREAASALPGAPVMDAPVSGAAVSGAGAASSRCRRPRKNAQ